MAVKTYLPMLLVVLRKTCQYIKRWEDKIKANVGEDNVALVDAVVVACEALEVVVDALTPSGT